MATYLISGVVTEGGSPVSGAQVLLLTRDAPARVLQRQTTDGSGIYQFSGLTNGSEYSVMVFDPSGGTSYNALIYDKVVPVSGSSIDPYWDNTFLLLANDSLANGSKLILDGSLDAVIGIGIRGDTQYATGGPTGLSTALTFDGTGDWLETPILPDLTWGTEDFTVELWGLSSQFNSGTKVLWDSRLVSGALGILIYTNGTNLIAHWDSATRITGTLPSNSVWTHIALTRESGNCKLWKGGSQTGSTVANALNYSNPYFARIGSDIVNGTSSHIGSIAALRVSRGIARYTAGFTPPTLPLTTN